MGLCAAGSIASGRAVYNARESFGEEVGCSRCEQFAAPSKASPLSSTDRAPGNERGDAGSSPVGVLVKQNYTCVGYSLIRLHVNMSTVGLVTSSILPTPLVIQNCGCFRGQAGLG